MTGFHFYTSAEIQAMVARRAHERKLGESLAPFPEERWQTALPLSGARFVLLGLPEDIGVRANGGIGGAATAWQPFLKSFLNLQETDRLSGKHFILLGHLDIKEQKPALEEADMQALRQETGKIDDYVFPVIRDIIAAGKIPVVIGGGHNNAFPLLKGASLAMKRPVNAINLDAHADFRVPEGRHSGNGFRYAYEAGFLEKYALPALHEGYNNQEMCAALTANPDMKVGFWEDVFLRKKHRWEDMLCGCLQHVDGSPFGVELDVDCIQGGLSSAATPVGFETREAAEYLYACGQREHALYLHLPEGISERNDGLTDAFTGKLLSYLVQAFAKGVLERDRSPVAA